MSFLKNRTSELTDTELLLRYRQSGDIALAGELYGRYMDLVYGVCLKYLKEPEDARDSTLSLFEELVVKLKKHEVEHFKSWLYQVAKNHCLMQLRKGKKFVRTDVDPELVQNEENVHLNGALEKEENFQKLDLCLGQLNPEQRKAVELFYLKGKCYKEIADETGMEWNKVRSFIQNGRRNLKLCMEKQSIQSLLLK